MKRFFSRCGTSVAMLAALGAAAASAQAIDLRGFRGVPWGASVQSLGEAKLAYIQGEVSCYRRERENMLYGDAPVKDVRYCFHHDHLFMVALDAQVDRATLERDFQATYGPPDWRVPAKAAWGDRHTRARVEMVTPAEGGASMVMYSNEFEPRARRDAKAY